MSFKKKKTLGQLVLLSTVKSRLGGMPHELLDAGEPALSMRLSALLNDIQIASKSNQE